MLENDLSVLKVLKIIYSPGFLTYQKYVVQFTNLALAIHLIVYKKQFF